MREYLRYRMRCCGISNSDIQTLLGVSEKTIRNKISGESDFTWSEVKLIRNTFFPDEEYDKLFESVTEPNAS